jgi:hypothetical protein
MSAKKKAKPKPKPTPKKHAFLAAFRLTASVTKAAAAVRMERQLHYRWLRDDPAYPAEFEAAQEEAAQTLEDEAIRRAHEGVDEPVTYKGNFTYPPKRDENGEVVMKEGFVMWDDTKPPLAIRKYSDKLLIELLRRFRPQKYRTNASVEVTGKDGGPIEVNKRLAALSDDELAQFARIAKKLEPPE